MLHKVGDIMKDKNSVLIIILAVLLGKFMDWFGWFFDSGEDYTGTVSTIEYNPETGQYETVTRTYSHYIVINGEKYPVDIDNSGSETRYYYYHESNGVGAWSPILGDNISKIRPKV